MRGRSKQRPYEKHCPVGMNLLDPKMHLRAGSLVLTLPASGRKKETRATRVKELNSLLSWERSAQARRCCFKGKTGSGMRGEQAIADFCV
jgi:hypothetical protein